MTDAKVIKSFNIYYNLIQRDNPDNKEAAMKTAAIMSQTQLIKEELAELSSKIVYQAEYNYDYKLDNIIDALKNISTGLNNLEDAIKRDTKKN